MRKRCVSLLKERKREREREREGEGGRESKSKWEGGRERENKVGHVISFFLTLPLTSPALLCKAVLHIQLLNFAVCKLNGTFKSPEIHPSGESHTREGPSLVISVLILLFFI